MRRLGEFPVQLLTVQTRGSTAALRSQLVTTSPASDPENRKERSTWKGVVSSFLTALPSPKPIREVQSQVCREDTSIAEALPAQGPGGGMAGEHLLPPPKARGTQIWPPPCRLLQAAFAHRLPLPPPQHTILNKYAWPRPTWECWRATIVISRNAQTPAKIHFPNAWLFWEPNLLLCSNQIGGFSSVALQ